MANQQLVDYIKGQMTAGVSETDIKKILKDAGWPDAEAEEGFKLSGGSSVASVVAASPIVSTSQPIAAKPVEVVKVEPKKESMSFDFMSNPGGMSSAAIVSPKGKENKPLAMSMDVAAAPVGKKASILPWIVAGVAIVIAIGTGAYFYMQGSTSSSDVASLTAANASLTSQLAALKGTTVSSADLDAAKADATELLSELNLFANAGAGTSTSIKFDLKGLIGNAKAQYTLTTARGVVLTVKNSKDLKVDTALKPLIGGTAQLSGTHIIGTYEITVDGLNGAPLETPVVATSTPSTSTTPGGTSTLPKL